MSDIKLFRLNGSYASEVKATASHLEKPLQNLIEQNLAACFGIRFVATEYSTGKTHAGRIDTLGLDENDCPVIIEYKRSSAENVINQGLFYLDWLMDHQAEYKLLVLDRLGKDAADAIDWSSPRMVCIANDFTRYDAHAVQQIDRVIELVRYRRFGPDLILFELVNSISSPAAETPTKARPKSAPPVESDPKPRPRWLVDMPPAQAELLQVLQSYVLSLGDDVQQKNQKHYIAFKRLRNFATVIAQKKNLLLFLHLDPKAVELTNGFSRDVTGLGHWGTGDLEMLLSNAHDLEKAKPLIERAYGGTLL